MRYRELLEILKEFESKSPDLLDQSAALADSDASLQMQLVYTLGVAPKLFFIPTYGEEDGS
jgi:hypothetical protein